MDTDPKLNFNDTAVAFSYKSDRELKKANLIFTLVNNPTVSKIATGAAKLGLALHLPIKGMIRATVFSHFCGGENIKEGEKTIQQLGKFHVGTILDYSVEGAKTEEGFEQTTKETLLTFEKAKGNAAVPFCVFKVTGLATMDLLEKIQSKIALTDEEQAAATRLKDRVNRICAKAYEYSVPVLVDAEDSWIQGAIDDLAYEMMQKYNQQKAIVFNTFQMYRADMVDNLKEAHEAAVKQNYYLGVKMVRGAYMEKEAARAEKLNYKNPIQPSKAATDDGFNKGLEYCIDHLDRIMLMCGSHNEYSNLYLTELMAKNNVAKEDKRVWFAQLLGMSDNISFNLAKAGYNVAKYVPYGPVEAVMPYLIRRASENTSVAGQSSRELTMIRKELSRRKSA